MNSKRKGNRFERIVSQWLSQWTGFKFERNRLGSGAWHSNKDAGADITCTDPKHAHRCRISVECKSYKTIKFEHVLLGTKGSEIEKFWKQAVEDANRTSKVPILIMRYNSMPKAEFFMVVDSDLVKVFLTKEMEKHRYMMINTKDLCLYVFMASSVKEAVNYKMVHKLAKNLLKSK